MTTAPFKPAWWSRNPHLQTLWPFLFRRGTSPVYRRQRFELADGDFIDIDWLGEDEQQPIVVLLHGLEGGSDSHYIRSVSNALATGGLRVAVMHFRGCSGEPNRLARGYHSGDTEDIAAFVDSLLAKEPTTLIAAVGFSLGGNVLLKWCGETGEDCPLQFAIAVSVPFDLTIAAESLASGLSRVYQWWLVRSLRRTTLAKIETGLLDYARNEILRLKTFEQFDDKVTAPLHGFADAADYYHRCSSRPWLSRIRIPALLIQAKDDPFLDASGIPDEHELADSVALEASVHGGHVGFISGAVRTGEQDWLATRIRNYALEQLSSADIKKGP